MPDSRAGFDVRHFVINSAFSFGFRHSEMIVRSCGATTCNPPHASLYQSLALTGRYRSGQTGQTVNLLALRLRWFESSPAQITLPESLSANSSVASSLATFPTTTVSAATVAASAASGRSGFSWASFIHS